MLKIMAKYVGGAIVAALWEWAASGPLVWMFMLLAVLILALEIVGFVQVR